MEFEMNLKRVLVSHATCATTQIQSTGEGLWRYLATTCIVLSALFSTVTTAASVIELKFCEAQYWPTGVTSVAAAPLQFSGHGLVALGSLASGVQFPTSPNLKFDEPAKRFLLGQPSGDLAKISRKAISPNDFAAIAQILNQPTTPDSFHQILAALAKFPTLSEDGMSLKFPEVPKHGLSRYLPSANSSVVRSRAETSQTVNPSDLDPPATQVVPTVTSGGSPNAAPTTPLPKALANTQCDGKLNALNAGIRNWLDTKKYDLKTAGGALALLLQDHTRTTNYLQTTRPSVSLVEPFARAYAFAVPTLRNAMDTALKADVDGYVAACLNRGDDELGMSVGAIVGPRPASYAGPSPSKDMSTVDGRTCTATWVGDNTILTARHCFLDGEHASAPLMSPEQIQSHYVQFPGVAGKHFRVCGFSQSAPQAYPVPSPAAKDRNTANDYVYLKIANAMDEGLVALRWAPDDVLTGQRLYLAGANPFDAVLSSNTKLLATSESIDGCDARQMPTNPCLLHACQTLPGFSGAPVLLKSDLKGSSTRSIVGIHVTVAKDFGGAWLDTNQLNQQCSTEPQTYAGATKNAPNLAIRPPVKTTK